MFGEIGRKPERSKHGSERILYHLGFKTVNRSLLGVGLLGSYLKSAFVGGRLKTLVGS
jgi:hypothetical protein